METRVLVAGQACCCGGGGGGGDCCPDIHCEPMCISVTGLRLELPPGGGLPPEYVFPPINLTTWDDSVISGTLSGTRWAGWTRLLYIPLATGIKDFAAINLSSNSSCHDPATSNGVRLFHRIGILAGYFQNNAIPSANWSSAPHDFVSPDCNLDHLTTPDPLGFFTPGQPNGFVPMTGQLFVRRGQCPMPGDNCYKATCRAQLSPTDFLPFYCCDNWTNWFAAPASIASTQVGFIGTVTTSNGDVTFPVGTQFVGSTYGGRNIVNNYVPLLLFNHHFGFLNFVGHETISCVSSHIDCEGRLIGSLTWYPGHLVNSPFSVPTEIGHVSQVFSGNPLDFEVTISLGPATGSKFRVVEQ